jgi:hypothetical protein
MAAGAMLEQKENMGNGTLHPYLVVKQTTVGKAENRRARLCGAVRRA